MRPSKKVCESSPKPKISQAMVYDNLMPSPVSIPHSKRPVTACSSVEGRGVNQVFAEKPAATHIDIRHSRRPSTADKTSMGCVLDENTSVSLLNRSAKKGRGAGGAQDTSSMKLVILGTSLPDKSEKEPAKKFRVTPGGATHIESALNHQII
jgi:hypothetical protein